MEKTVIWESIQSLNRYEQKAFEKFIRSPYFNSRDDLVKLTDYFFSLSPGKVPTREEIYQSVFGPEKYDAQHLRLVLSYLQRKIEQFWTIELFRKEEEQNLIVGLQAIRRRNLSKNYLKKQNEVAEYLEKKEQEGVNDFLKKLLVRQEQLSTAFRQNDVRQFDYNDIIGALDIFYIGSKLRYLCIAVLYRMVYDRSFEFDIPRDLLALVESNEKYLQVPFISFYYRFFNILEREEVAEFAALREDFLSHRSHLSEEELREIYTMILNFYVRGINRGKMNLVGEALDFYKLGLELGALLEEGVLSGITYSNIVAMAIGRNDIEWVDRFIEEYKMKLPKAIRQPTYSLNRARLEYTLKNYNKAIRLVRNVNYNDIFQAATSRILLMKIYWESGNFEVLQPYIHAFTLFLKRKKVIGYHYKNWYNLAKYFQRLLKVNPYNEKQIDRLIRAVKNEQILPERKWFLEQLNQLKSAV